LSRSLFSAYAAQAAVPGEFWMNTTSASLLERLQQSGPIAADWQRLHDLYLPLIRSWLARTPGLADEAADVAQEVMIVVFRELPGFQRQREGSFRAWLRLVTANRVRTWQRARQRQPQVGLDSTADFLSQLEDSSSQLARQWDREHDRHVFDKLLSMVEADFEPLTWKAFRLFALKERKAAEVAAELGLSENAVLLAKSRILKRLREESAGLVD
jgi:RNA polymerase sigma-70 factor, ECF subfamily